MSHPTKLANSSSNANANANSTASPVIKVGSTGTVASLMTRELDNIKITQITPQDAAAASSSSHANTRRKKYQSAPISVPCGVHPKKIVSPKKNNLSKEEADKLPRSARRNGYDAPMLRGDGVGTTDQNSNPSLAKGGKKGHLNAVEVVDLKCNNPMSSRLRKLGFSKLSETIA